MHIYRSCGHFLRDARMQMTAEIDKIIDKHMYLIRSTCSAVAPPLFPSDQPLQLLSLLFIQKSPVFVNRQEVMIRKLKTRNDRLSSTSASLSLPF
jgi:hypothetical protein